MAIFKQELQLGPNTFHVQGFQSALSVQMQNGKIMLWYQCDPSAAEGDWYSFDIYPTGAHSTPRGHFIGTVQDDMGLVWHVFQDS